MRRIAIFRDGNMMGAMIGPNLVIGACGFGEIVPQAFLDMADLFDKSAYLCGRLGVRSAGGEEAVTEMAILANQNRTIDRNGKFKCYVCAQSSTRAGRNTIY